MLMVAVRQQILDELTERTDGQLPDYVFVTAPGHGGADHTSREPHRPH
jgi:hypothetical protein